MEMTRVLFLHGLESKPMGSKFHALRRAGFDVHAPDLSNRALYERVAAATKFVAQWKVPYYIVGSSFGGIAALFMTQIVGHEPKGLVLCAPALRHTEARMISIAMMGVHCPVTIIHSTDDDVCDIAHSREYAKIHGAALVEVKDGHRLQNSEEVIISTLKALIKKTS